MPLHRFASRLLHIYLPACGVLVLLAAPLRAESLLRWKFTPGEKLHVAVRQLTELDTTAGPTPRKMKVDTTMEMDWVVDSVDEQGVAQMTHTITRLKMRLETLGAPPVEFDTASTEQPVGTARYFEAASRLVGVNLAVAMTDRGEIESVKLTDEARKLLDEALAGASLPALFSSEGLRQTLKQSAIVLPAKAVNPGDTWETSSAAKLPLGDVKQQTTYKYVGPRDHDGRMLDAIELTSKLELAPPADATRAARIAEQEHTGALWFDAEAGRFTATDVTQKLVTESPYRGTKVRVSAVTTLSTTFAPVE